MIFKDKHKFTPLTVDKSYEDGDFIVNFISEDCNFDNEIFKKICELSPSFMSTTIGYLNKHGEEHTLDCIIVDKFFSLCNRSIQSDKPKEANTRKTIMMISRFFNVEELDIKKIHVNPSNSGLNQAQLAEAFKNLLVLSNKMNKVSVIVYK